MESVQSLLFHALRGTWTANARGISDPPRGKRSRFVGAFRVQTAQRRFDRAYHPTTSCRHCAQHHQESAPPLNSLSGHYLPSAGNRRKFCRQHTCFQLIACESSSFRHRFALSDCRHRNAVSAMMSPLCNAANMPLPACRRCTPCAS